MVGAMTYPSYGFVGYPKYIELKNRKWII